MSDTKRVIKESKRVTVKVTTVFLWYQDTTEVWANSLVVRNKEYGLVYILNKTESKIK